MRKARSRCILSSLTLLLLCAEWAPSAQSSLVATAYGRPKTLVVVQGKRRLNLVCVGKGTPTVIFLSGLGGGTFDWRKVQPAVGQVTRACAYDRAGYGFSDPATVRSDVANTVTDFHVLLHSKAVTTPVVLVGHSLGGLYATSYALRYPRDVAALILVEAAFSGQAHQISQAIGPAAAARMEVTNKQTIRSLDRCVALAAAGRLARPAEQASDCLDSPADPDPDVHRERNREAKSVAFERALRSEYEMANITDADGKTQDDRQTDLPNAKLGAIPLVVLTRGDSEALSDLSANEIAKAELAWRAGHDRLAALSTAGVNVIVPHSRHFVQLDQPEVVTKQILAILDAVRR